MFLYALSLSIKIEKVVSRTTRSEDIIMEYKIEFVELEDTVRGLNSEVMGGHGHRNYQYFEKNGNKPLLIHSDYTGRRSIKV
jgi:hypothetical protein